MKIAVIDLLFRWPPTGGAARDLFETFRRIAQVHEVKLFRPVRSDERPPTMEGLPFPYQWISSGQGDSATLIFGLLTELLKFDPDLVFLADGWMMKARLGACLTDEYPTVIRQYAYEMICPRNNELWKHTYACSFSDSYQPETCMTCARQYRDAILMHRGTDNPLTAEMTAAAIWDGSYSADVEKTYSRARRVITYNHMLADFIQNCFGRSCDVVPGGVNPDDFSDVLPHTLEELASLPFRILAFGRMNDPAKGGDDVVEAVRMLRKKGLDLQLMITRDPKMHESWIQETGWIGPEELKKELKFCHCVIVPSRWQEAFGMTWLEALAASRPVVCSRVAGPMEYLVHEQNALLYPPGDVEQLAICIEQMVSRPELAQTLVEQGLLTVRQLTWDAAAGKTRQILESANTL